MLSSIIACFQDLDKESTGDDDQQDEEDQNHTYGRAVTVTDTW